MTLPLGLWQWLAAAAVILAGTILQGSIGFGVALLGAPLLYLVEPWLVPGPILIVGLAVPFGNVLGPLVVWLLKKDESEPVDRHGRASLNFQITWSVLLFVAFTTVFVGIGFVLVPLLGLAWLILVVLGTIRASEGELYDYPLTVDLV